MRLGSCVAVALTEASGYSSNEMTSLGTSMCQGVAKKKRRGEMELKLKRNVG